MLGESMVISSNVSNADSYGYASGDTYNGVPGIYGSGSSFPWGGGEWDSTGGVFGPDRYGSGTSPWDSIPYVTPGQIFPVVPPVPVEKSIEEQLKELLPGIIDKDLAKVVEEIIKRDPFSPTVPSAEPPKKAPSIEIDEAPKILPKRVIDD